MEAQSFATRSGQTAFFLDHTEGEEASGLRERMDKRQDFIRATCWTFCSAAAIFTAKQLMIIHRYHYPLTIAIYSFLATLLVYSVALSLGSPKTQDAKWWRQRSRPDSLWPNSTWLVMLPASLVAGASLPMLLEGILHMPSLPVMVMLFPVTYATEEVVLFICSSPSRSQKSSPWETLIVIVASAIVLFNEYRLMVPGLVWGVTGVLFVGVTRALFVIGSERCESELDGQQQKLNAYHGFTIMSLVSGFIFSVVSWWFVENDVKEHLFPFSTLGLLVINIVCMVGTAVTGTTLLAYSPFSLADTRPEFTNVPPTMVDFFASYLSSILVILVAIHTSPIVVLSGLQIAASMVAASFLLGAAQLHKLFFIALDSTHFTKILGVSQTEFKKPSHIISTGAWVILILISSGIISTLSSITVNSIPPSLPATLDKHYTPTSRFDIVVSMYDESPSSVKSMLDSIKSTTLLSTLNPNIIIYTKDPNVDVVGLKAATGATTIVKLPNLGREGGTYLHHITHNWDTLAEQTMFIQAHAHNMRELIPRIESYLVPESGMLSLGFTGVLCSCKSCGDRWGWSDGFDLIPSLYNQIYSKNCQDSTEILLSYKGQFVASARRIRGVKKEVYEVLEKAIESSAGWSHDAAIVGDRTDTPDNPFLGFTVERIWGLLMQCATDGRVAAKCPSLLSGMGRGGEVEDCQCLDRVRGSLQAVD